MEGSKKIEIVQGSIKHYDWGGKTFLPQLLHLKNNQQKPYAEYWLGGILEERFGKIPFLLKVLDVEKMLSIQVHPTKAVAIKKYKDENEKN
ncbi:MAG: type I phosphomannose isomerase catalytic subunit, partial [Flavitalea sp.]